MGELEQQLDSIGEQATAEWRIFGPPGTGKTTSVSRQVRRAVAKYGPADVLVTSFSRAAAAEVAGRDLPIPPEQIGTLHAHCYRALGRPALAESKVADWNESYPHWRIKQVRQNNLDESADDAAGGLGEGDRLLAIANRWRNRMVPIEMWPDMVARAFAPKWEEWKQSIGALDFTDLIEHAGRDCKLAPGQPSVLIADEAQDFTRLQLKVVRQWGNGCAYFITVGDDDQTLYIFTGATPDAFLVPEIPGRQKIVLSQSYRVPQAVHALATRWIAQVEHREPKEYLPTAERGQVLRIGYTFQQPEALVKLAESEIAAGRTVMFLASCAYMLNSIRATLIAESIPFHNPYRRRRGDWNPLYTGNGISAAERVAAFAKPHHSLGDESQPWTAKDLRAWADWVIAEGTFQRGGKSACRQLAPGTVISIEQLQDWLEPGAYATLMDGIMRGALGGYLSWWRDRVMVDHEKTASYPVRLVQKHGLSVLAETPRVILGTIHSVKGGEADTVILSPDISFAAYDQSWIHGHGEGYDAIIRCFYVAMTRARKTLVLCEASSGCSVNL